MSHRATNWAIQQRGLKPAAKVVLWHLCDRFNPDYGCFPDQDTLADDCEMSRSSLNNQLSALEERGLIVREQRQNPRTKKQESTRYRFPFEDDFPCPKSGHGTVSKKEPEPCPKNGESRVQNLDSNPVREPVKEPVNERERASADNSGLENGGNEPQETGLTSVQRRKLIDKAVGLWPAGTGSVERAIRELEKLSDDDLGMAVEKIPAWLAHWNRKPRDHVHALSTYAKDRLFANVPEPPAEPEQTHVPAEPLQRAWVAYWISLALKGPVDKMQAAPGYIQSKIDAGGIEGERMRRRHIALNGYPEINFVRDQWEFGRGVGVPCDIARIAERFGKCRTDSALFAAWGAECERRAWPWFGSADFQSRPWAGEWVWLPVTDAPIDDEAKFVQAAINEFETALAGLSKNEGNTDDEPAPERSAEPA